MDPCFQVRAPVPCHHNAVSLLAGLGRAGRQNEYRMNRNHDDTKSHLIPRNAGPLHP